MPAQLRAVEPPDPTDDTRAQLRQQIARVSSAQTAVSRAQDARDRVHGELLSAMRSLDTARDRLREAESDNQQHRVATLLGEMTGAPALSELKRAVELAETVVAGTRADEQLLDAEIKRRQTALSYATDSRARAIAEVLKPVAAALLQTLRGHLAAAAGLRGALHCLPSDCLENYWDSAETFPEDITLNSRWRGVAEALSTNADAPIPEI